jgi:hypothetical protein
MDTRTYTIPLELNTSLQLAFILNLNLGLGADLAFGSNKLTFDFDSTVNTEGTGIASTTPGTLWVKGGGTMSPTLFNPKLMFDLGFKFGPVIIDIPLTWYFLNHGVSSGVTVGVVW